MKLQSIKRAFTLIELLVVITIIGILATGGVSVFTTQLQGARDSTRIGDMKLMETGVHQYFNDQGTYPAETWFTWSIKQYLSKDLEDPKKGDSICWADASTNDELCGGYYAMGDDSFGLSDSAFKIGIAFEKKTNFEKQAINSNDGWNVTMLFETFAGAGADIFTIGDSAASGTLVY